MKNFLIIFSIVLIVQIPGWILILARDSGQINDLGNEAWIKTYEVIATIFSFPLYYFIKDFIDSYLLAYFIYLTDLVIISLFISFAINLSIQLKKNR